VRLDELILDYDRHKKKKKKKVSEGITIVTITMVQVIMKFASKITGKQSYETTDIKKQKRIYSNKE
jgi:hypothetical protein